MKHSMILPLNIYDQNSLTAATVVRCCGIVYPSNCAKRKLSLALNPAAEASWIILNHDISKYTAFIESRYILFLLN